MLEGLCTTKRENSSICLQEVSPFRLSANTSTLYSYPKTDKCLITSKATNMFIFGLANPDTYNVTV